VTYYVDDQPAGTQELTYYPGEREGSIGMEAPGATSFTLEAVPANPGDYDIQIYQNGQLVTGHVPASAWNMFNIVVREKNSNESSPLAVYAAYVYYEGSRNSNYITDIHIDGKSVYNPQGWYSGTVVSTETDSVSLTLTTENTSGPWGVYYWNTREYVDPAGSQYTLPLKHGWNEFTIYLVSSNLHESFETQERLVIYRGDPAILENVELTYYDFNRQEYLFEWYEFMSWKDSYNITIDVPEEYILPENLYFYLRAPDFAGVRFEVEAYIDTENDQAEKQPLQVMPGSETSIYLPTGQHVIELHVTAISTEDQSVIDTNTYTFNINRKPSRNADLQSVTFAVYGLAGELHYFDSFFDGVDIVLYESATEGVLFQASTPDWRSSVQFSVNGQDYEDFVPGRKFGLMPGEENILTIRVISESMDHISDYPIRIRFTDP
jgi:hypothetical protein